MKQTSFFLVIFTFNYCNETDFIICKLQSICNNIIYTEIKIERVNIHAHEKETDKDVRGSPQPWGYVHQKVLHAGNIHFIIRLQTATECCLHFSKNTEV